MLDREAIEDIALIKSTANQVWGNKCQFGEIREINSPYPEFDLPMRLYNVCDITIEYERSTVGIMVKTEQGYIGLSRLTEQQVFKGLKSCVPENLLHNFKILDGLIKNDKMI